jgi:hypothetical protein
MTRSLSTPRADHLRVRLPLALGAALLALAARLATPAPPARTADAIARMLGDAVGGVVGPDGFVWEERGGFLNDALLGRRVLFLATPAAPGGGGADLYRARVRLTRSGRPVELDGVRNLTDTPLGADGELVARGRRVAFATSAAGGVQAVSLLDLDGDHADRQARTFGERLRASVEGWLETGSLRGASRAEITFEKPPSAVRLDLTDDALVMALGPDALPAALDMRTGELHAGGKDAFGARAQRIPHPVRPVAEVAERSARRLIGPGAARAVERLALGLRRLAALGRAEPDTVPPGLGAPLPPEPAPPGLPVLWPPPPVAAVIDPALPGEGAWAAVDDPYPRGSAEPKEGALTPFVATFLRPDPARPRARVHLLAIDTRRLELRLQAGYDAPLPATGPRGTGRLPERSPLAEQVIGAIGLGVPSGGGPGLDAPGMVVEGRALVPPRTGAATLAVDCHGRPLLGAWPFGEELPPSIRSLWQGAALFERGPTGLPGQTSTSWLAASDDGGLIAERAALCTTERGFIVHAWGPSLDAAALGEALARVGCEAGLSLGRAPAPLGFVFLGRHDGGGWLATPLSPAMSLSPERLTSGSPGAFAYLIARSPMPLAPLSTDSPTPTDGGKQPHPAWLPAVYSIPSVHLGAQVSVSAFAPDRFTFRLRAGTREVSPRGAAPLPSALAPDEQARVLAVIGVGTGRRRGPRGLAVAGAVGLRFRGEGGLLLARGDRVEIRAAGDPALGPEMDATELPLTADDGKLRPEAREIGSMRKRGAACLLDDGTLLVATTTFDSDEATTEALLDLGCLRVIALDRGTHRSAFVHRAGSEAPPEGSYEETSLFAVERPMPGRASLLGSAGAP